MKIVFALMALSILGCSHKIEPTQNQEFNRFVESIPVLQLPFHTDCDSYNHIATVNVDSAIRNKFLFNHEDIVGKILNANNRIIILCAGKADNLIPVLRVYDNDGNVLSEKEFMHNYCGRSLDNYESQHFYISTELFIKEIDSLLVFKMDKEYSTITDTSKKEITVTDYVINEYGIIVSK